MSKDKNKSRFLVRVAAIKQMKHMDFAKHAFKIALSWRNLTLRSVIASSSQTVCRRSDGKPVVLLN